VDNSMAAVGMDPSQAAIGNLARGYADTKIENDVIGGNSYNTIAVFNAPGANPVVISPGGSAPSSPGQLAYGLNETLGAGHAAIAPASTVLVAGSPAYGWWDVDPSTGSTVGRMTGGAGDAAVEYGFILRAYSAMETAAEAEEAIKACGEESAAECGSAICKGAFAGGLIYRTFKHAKHVRSWQSLVGHFAFDAGVEVIKVGFCRLPDEGSGGHGGGHGGGAPPEH
jgi:hypothetical protein